MQHMAVPQDTCETMRQMLRLYGWIRVERRLLEPGLQYKVCSAAAGLCAGLGACGVWVRRLLLYMSVV